MLGLDQYSFLELTGGSLHPAPFNQTEHSLYRLMPLGQAWTLGLEMTFYLMAPFVVRRRIATVLALIGASFAVRLGLQAGWGLDGDPWSYRFFPSELALFLAGCIAYHCYRNEAMRPLLVTVSAAIFVVLLINRWHGLTRVASVAFLAAAIVAIPSLFRVTKRWRWDRELGELSYSLYLCHGLVIFILDAAIRFEAPLYRALAIVVLSCLLSVALYLTVEIPLERWRAGRTAARLAGGQAVTQS